MMFESYIRNYYLNMFRHISFRSIKIERVLTLNQLNILFSILMNIGSVVFDDNQFRMKIQIQSSSVDDTNLQDKEIDTLDQVNEQMTFNGNLPLSKSSKRNYSSQAKVYLFALLLILLLFYFFNHSSNETSVEEKKMIGQNENKPLTTYQPVKNSQSPIIETAHVNSTNITQLQIDQTIKKSFVIPKFVWIFQQPYSNYLHFRCIENIKYYGRISGYEVIIVNSSNYESHLQKNRAIRLNLALDWLRRLRLIKVDEDAIMKYLILINLVANNGGVMIHRGPYALTEDLSWIEQIADSPFKLGRKADFVPQIIAFYHAEFSPKRSVFNIKPYEGFQEIDKFTHEYPALEQMFLAAVKQTQYVQALIQTLYHMLSTRDKMNQYSKQYDFQINIQFPKGLVFIANHVILKDRQKLIDSKTPANFYKQFAYEQYGIAFINSNYGPSKMKTFYQYWKPRQKPFYSSYHDIARYRLEDYYDYSGPIKYLCHLYQQDIMSQYLRSSANGEDITIYRGSLLQKYYFPEGYFSFIVDNPEKSFTNETNQLWDTLQKKVWLFWNNGFENSPPFVQLCVDNLKRTAEASGFEIFLVTSQNINQYIPQQQVDHINQTLKKINNVKIQAYADFYRLALLYHNGGVYFDSTSIAIQKFDWLLKIGRFPSQFIFNRFDTNPKAMLSFHPSEGMPGTWTIQPVSQGRNVKSQWYQGFENSFIAAEKHSEFIKEWKDCLFDLILLSYDEIMVKFTQAEIHKFNFIDKTNQYLLPMDTAKYVLGRRQKLLQKDPNSTWVNAAHYYKLWTFSTYLASTRLRYNHNYEDPRSFVNTYFTRYSPQYADKIVGKTRFFFKLFKDQKYFWQKQFFDVYQDCNFTEVTHPKSIFRKFMWDDKFKPIFIQSKNKQIEKIKKQESQKRKRQEQENKKKDEEKKKIEQSKSK